MNLQKQQGVTLIELLLVLAVILAIIIGVTRIYQVVDNNRKVNDAVNMILAVYQAGAQYESLPTGVSIQTFTKAGYLPDSFASSTANPWGGSIQADNPNNSAYSLEVILNAVPADQCNNLGAKFTKMSNATVDTSACGTGTDPKNAFSVTFNMNVNP